MPDYVTGVVRRHRRCVRSRRRALQVAGLLVLADKGYISTGQPVLTPYRGRNKPEPHKDANHAHARLRALGERAIAQPKSRRILRRLHLRPHRAGHIAKAISALQAREALAH
jgi:DDE superfamily endonuclease